MYYISISRLPDSDAYTIYLLVLVVPVCIKHVNISKLWITWSWLRSMPRSLLQKGCVRFVKSLAFRGITTIFFWMMLTCTYRWWSPSIVLLSFSMCWCRSILFKDTCELKVNNVIYLLRVTTVNRHQVWNCSNCRFHAHSINTSRQDLGEYHHSYSEVGDHPERFHAYIRMSVHKFKYLISAGHELPRCLPRISDQKPNAEKADLHRGVHLQYTKFAV